MDSRDREVEARRSPPESGHDPLMA